MKPGELKIINGKLYGVCAECDKMVRVDKPILGSMHICVDNTAKSGKEHK